MNQLQVGDIFAKKYKLEERLGEGTSKEAWRAVHLLMNRTTALKIFKETSPKIEQILSDEATHHAKIGKHPHIVDIYDVGIDPETGQAFYSEEFVPGETLKQRMSREHIQEKEFFTIISQIAGALNHMHKQGIIYRDLKPENIIMETAKQKPSIKITDFGGSTKPGKKEIPYISADKTILLRAIDTFEMHSDQKVDMYSLGVMLYKMTTSHYPYEGNTPEEIKQKIQTTMPKKPHLYDNVQIGSWLEKTIMTLLSKDPKKRPTAKQLQKNIWWHRHWTKVILAGIYSAGIISMLSMNTLFPLKALKYTIAYLSNKTLTAQNTDMPAFIKNITYPTTSFAFDQDQCLFATRKKDIYRYDLNSNEILQITRTPDKEETNIQVSPSGLTIAFMIGKDLYVAGRRGSKELERKVLENIDEYTWYTMKDQITYRKGKEIFITEPQEHPFAEKNAKKITEGACPIWNSCGTALFYRTTINQHNSITFKVFWHSDNIGIKEPIEGEGYKIADDAESFTLSRDSLDMAYYSKKENQLIILASETHTQRQTEPEFIEDIKNIQFHPENKNQILFQAKVKGEKDYEIFIFERGTSNLKRITNNDFDDTNPIYLSHKSLK